MRKLLLSLLLTIPAFAQHSVSMTWSYSQGASDPATGFHVWKSICTNSTTCTGTPITIATINGTSTLNYTDTAVTAGQILQYYVTSFNSGGDSVTSNNVICTVPFSPPAAPSGLSATVK